MRGQKVGFIGLGIMGSSMASNLLKGGFEVHVYNRSGAKAKPLAEQGAKVANSIAELADVVDRLLLCVTDEHAVEDIIFGSEGVIESECDIRSIIDFSTISPSSARDFGSRLEEVGISYLDAPVSGGDVGAREGTLTIMAGGSEIDFENAKDVFTWLGRKIVHTGPVGSGQLTKCVNQLVVAINVAAMTEGLLFAEEMGLDLTKTLDTISSGAAGSWALSNYAPRIIAHDLKPGFYAKDMLKDLRIALNEADAEDMPAPVSSLVKELYTAMCRSEDALLGNHALISLYRRMMRGE
jgi:3-hydroxyisobutyrate dehydrogenase